MKKIIISLLLVLGFSGCLNKIKNTTKRDGGFFWTSPADYIIVNSSGNKILDIYKLHSAFVSNQENSDGVGFVDEEGNYTLLQGEVKIIRITGQDVWDKYTEYHYDRTFSKKLK